MISYLRFLLKSTNQHGVHSPYVFNYLTKGLYGKKADYRKERSKQVRFVLSTIAYFDFKNIRVGDELLMQTIRNYFPQCVINGSQEYDDLIVADTFEIADQYKKRLNNDSLLIILNTDEQHRKRLSETSDFTLFMDFYHTAVLSARKEQLRQNFFLRY